MLSPLASLTFSRWRCIREIEQQRDIRVAERGEGGQEREVHTGEGYRAVCGAWCLLHGVDIAGREAGGAGKSARPLDCVNLNRKPVQIGGHRSTCNGKQHQTHDRRFQLYFQYWWRVLFNLDYLALDG